ncbi:MAG: hypothetical protein AB7P01_11825, partial [Bacteroidia bacterium]
RLYPKLSARNLSSLFVWANEFADKKVNAISRVKVVILKWQVTFWGFAMAGCFSTKLYSEN